MLVVRKGEVEFQWKKEINVTGKNKEKYPKRAMKGIPFSQKP